jgi:ribonuclease D
MEDTLFTPNTSKAQLFLESWRDAERFQREFAMKTDPVSHHYNKLLSDHLQLAQGKEAKLRPRAKAVLRHFVKWQEAEQAHREKHKRPVTMDDLAAQKPKTLQAWRSYKRSVAPKEKRYHREAWLLAQEAIPHTLAKG